MLLRSTSILSAVSISSIFLIGLYAHQQDQRQPIGQRPIAVQSPEVRQPIGVKSAVVVAQPGSAVEQEPEVKVAVPENKKEIKKKKKKEKKRESIGEKASIVDRANPVVVATPPRQQERPVVNVAVPVKKNKKVKIDKSRQTLGDRGDKETIVVSHPRQQVGQQISVQRPVSHQVVTPVANGQRQIIGERSRSTQAPIAVNVYQSKSISSDVIVPTPIHRAERPIVSVGYESTPIVVAQPQRYAIVPRPLPQVIIIDRSSAAYSSAVLSPYSISRRGDNIQLDDGSSWRVRHRDRSAVRQWGNGDVIVVETGRFFSWSTYKLVNYTRGGVSVDVELNEADCNGILSHWVVELNPFEGYLRLQDGSVWRMSTNELLNWQVNDDVIIGFSKNFFSSQSSYILINPRVKTRLVAVFSL